MPSEISAILDIKKLAQDIGGWLTALIPLVAGVLITYHYIMKSAAQDEQAAAQHTRSIRTIAISAALGFASLALVTFLLRYVAPSNFAVDPSQQLLQPSNQSGNP